jgi:hypothetical protein
MKWGRSAALELQYFAFLAAIMSSGTRRAACLFSVFIPLKVIYLIRRRSREQHTEFIAL